MKIIIQSLLKGLAILLPIIVTVYLVQWLLVKLENRWALSQKEFQREHGLDVTPKPTREAILHMCTLMWQGVDHADTARKAYRATGPGLPLRGPISERLLVRSS